MVMETAASATRRPKLRKRVVVGATEVMAMIVRRQLWRRTQSSVRTVCVAAPVDVERRMNLRYEFAPLRSSRRSRRRFVCLFFDNC